MKPLVTYTHRYGSGGWPRFVDDNAPPPSLDDEIDELGDMWEGEEGGDFLDISGPYPVPQANPTP